MGFLLTKRHIRRKRERERERERQRRGLYEPFSRMLLIKKYLIFAVFVPKYPKISWNKFSRFG